MKKCFTINEIRQIYVYLRKKLGCNEPLPGMTFESYQYLWKEMHQKCKKS